MELKDLIREYKENNNITSIEIARRLGVTKSTVSKWLSGDVKRLRSETVAKMSEVFGYDVQAMLDGHVIEFKKPILGYVKAGYDLFAEENYLGEEDVTILEKEQGDYFLKVTGDSMIGDGIIDGSLAYVKSCTEVPSGSIAVVLIGDEVTIKHFIKKQNMIILEASNPQVDNRYFSPSEVNALPVKVLGKVVYVKTKY